MLLLFCKWGLKFDVYLLRFHQGSEIPAHTDPVKAGRHYRLNIVLVNAQKGGEFHCSNPIFETKRIKLFRPDISEHSVTKVEMGRRYLISIGWLRAN